MGDPHREDEGRLRSIFDEEFLRRLEGLHLVAQKLLAGQRQAERRSKKIGQGLEYADHRDYSVGDDFRSIDWNVYGRSDKLLVRLYEEEEDLSIYLLTDVSDSMMLGGSAKAEYAMKVSAALGYIGLASLDRVAVLPFADGLTATPQPVRGKGQIHKILRQLSGSRTGGRTLLEQSARALVHRFKRRGVAVVVSDFYDEHGFEDALNLLRYHRFELFVIQITDEAELDPELSGDIQILDCETGAAHDVTVTPELLARYRRAHVEFCGRIRDFCRARHVPYFLAPVQVPFDELVLRIFREGGLVR
jgi:uncharacterized protein (DUF58 family)